MTVDKDWIRENAEQILSRSALPAETRVTLLRDGVVDDPQIVVQVSSGSTGRPLYIPRSKKDVGDIARRVWTPVVEQYGRIPERIALIGGISHTQAAVKLDIADTELRSFSMEDIEGIARFDPVVLSCYPSVARELVVSLPSMPSLCAIKLGGERIFEADLAKIFARFPEAMVVEQFGSTEMPAVALRTFHADRRSPYELQKQRFSFALEPGDGWQPLVARDDFADLLFPIGEFYQTGDEVRIENGQAVELRRSGDAAIPYYPDLEGLLKREEVINVQILLSRDQIRVHGSLPEAVEFAGRSYEVIAERPARIRPSNKLPLIIRD